MKQGTSSTTPVAAVKYPMAQLAVLDTNVVLDWLVFDDPACHPLRDAVESGHLVWLATPELREEFDRVIDRGVGAARRPDRHAIDAAWRRYSLMCDPPVTAAGPVGLRTRCRCTDPDDQKFIDLALHSGARWLLSRDKAVLKLAREARPSGLAIVTPHVWHKSASRSST